MKNSKLLVIAIATTVLLSVLMQFMPSFKVDRLLCIEFAATPSEFYELVRPYTGTETDVLYHNTMVDFIYMMSYSLMFHFAGLVVSSRYNINKYSMLLLWIPFLADFIENVLLLQMRPLLPDRYCCFTLFYFAVRIKWLMVIPGIVTVLYAIRVLLDRGKQK